ncbi:hypothetical protein HX871_26265 [Pseudomonas reactans]|uniref:Uncharacterized protein n=1 Tax=Pseudomonas reactans TaxID=117680 RepID=A0ABX2R1J0_9PSED|nr:hypothetical protein [Pseudomonas reactans]NWA42516.1 hypothetical protein [Pseudomonas reactans]NWC87214.1 hypothetical protein [Pseudomonas reactans]NWD30424.1 hypothetical protein [Pseudomonas reactans]NWD97942.1 hypothetical protein [Pseudomonas reactans]NWF16381.1 hypothetical protein [Pseudomonas reactans]
MSTFATGSFARSNPVAAPLSNNLETSRIPAFDAPERSFGEHFNASSHSAVIKLMMLTFGPRPTDLFNDVRGNSEGYDVTMKDGYRLHLSGQELQQAAAASRFAGHDAGVLNTANFMLAAFVKRKHLRNADAAGLPGFASVLTRTLQGETPFSILKGLGLSGQIQYVPTASVVSTGGKGVADSWDLGGSLIHGGMAHQLGRASLPDRSYTYVLVHDSTPKPRIIPAVVTPIVEPKVDLATTSARPEAAEVLRGFTEAERNFGDVSEMSSYVSVIKMMMLRFGRSPSDMFEKVEVVENGYSVTMKDGFDVKLSKEELRRTAEASRFTGPDAQMVADANFMLAAYVKRKQVNSNVPFDTALSSSLQGAHVYGLLKGMGVIGFLRMVSPDKLLEPYSVGVTDTHSYAGALVVNGIKHSGNKKEAVGKSYGYQLAADLPVNHSGRPAQFPAAPVGVKPDNIWSGFYQGVEGNCVTVSAIKAAMMRYGQNPLGIFKRVTESPEGFTITMRDSCTVRLTRAELEMARAAANFHGEDKGLVDDAIFLYAASAKRAQLENHEFRAGAGFDAALKTLNDGEVPGDALRRLGLYAFTRPSSVQELASGVPGTLANFRHSVVVVEGAMDEYGVKRDLQGSDWMQQGGHALKLV